MPSPSFFRAYAFFAHQASYTMTSASHALVQQGRPDARTAIGLAAGFIFLSDMFTGTWFSNSRGPAFSGCQA